MSNDEIIVTYELESLTYYRPDGTYVGVVKGMPYHVIPEDPLWEKAVEMATAMGTELQQEPPFVPSVTSIVLTARQLRIGLLKNGISSTTVISTINSISVPLDREEMLVEWEYGVNYTRNNALIQFLQSRLFSSESAFNEFWISSAAL